MTVSISALDANDRLEFCASIESRALAIIAGRVCRLLTELGTLELVAAAPVPSSSTSVAIEVALVLLTAVAAAAVATVSAVVAVDPLTLCGVPAAFASAASKAVASDVMVTDDTSGVVVVEVVAAALAS